MSGDMVGKVALVTGGSSGIGKAAGLAFAREGARIVIASRDQSHGEQAVRDIQSAGGEALWVQTDVSQAAEAQRMVEKTIQVYGRLDYAFNNGGSGGMGGWVTDILEEEWDKTIDGFLKSVWLCMKYEIPEILKTGGGAIVNNSSVDGQRAFPMDPAYSAAKHGVLGLTKSSAVQYARSGLRVNAVCPSWILTPPVENMIQAEPGSKDRMLLHQPVGRLGAPEEVAEAVIWLCSSKSAFITGTALAVDGGYLAV